MHQRLAAAASAAVLAILLAGCTASSPTPTPTPTAPAGSAAPTQPVAGGTLHFPTCDAVSTALAGMQGDLVFDPTKSASQTAQEAYPQRVCVYGSADGQTQLGVTLAGIPFQQSEIDGYATLPNAIADDRLRPNKAVLQNFTSSDKDFRLSLFDVAVSITIQGRSTTGPTSATIPALSLPAATDAAFALRALVR
ncbi:hypothetical protein BH11ACT4_BH11ACT4_22260 [soil metagenome]